MKQELSNKSIYVIYDAVNCMPNGDPDTGEQRYNELTQRALVSDLRLKRFARESMIIHMGSNAVFYWYDKSINETTESGSGAAARFEYFCNQNNIGISSTNEESNKDGDQVNGKGKKKSSKGSINAMNILLDNFMDVRMFGGVLTSKVHNAHVTGALQFNAETASMNVVEFTNNLVNRGNTTVFPSQGGDGGNNTGSMGRKSFIRYGVFTAKAKFSATTAELNHAKPTDLYTTLANLWDGISSINTQSKFGHYPIAIIIINHPTKKRLGGYIGRTMPPAFTPMKIDSKVGETSNIYSRDDYNMDFSELISAAKNEKLVSSVEVITDDADVLSAISNAIPNLEVIDPYTLLGL